MRTRWSVNVGEEIRQNQVRWRIKGDSRMGNVTHYAVCTAEREQLVSWASNKNESAQAPEKGQPQETKLSNKNWKQQ